MRQKSSAAAAPQTLFRMAAATSRGQTLASPHSAQSGSPGFLGPAGCMRMSPALRRSLASGPHSRRLYISCAGVASRGTAPLLKPEALGLLPGSWEEAGGSWAFRPLRRARKAVHASEEVLL